jgi:hypothetical protein
VIYIDGNEVIRVEKEDSNFMQIIEIPNTEGKVVKVEFTRASDLFGRIVLYSMELIGN